MFAYACFYFHLYFQACSRQAGCGGFGKGNFKELFKSVEDYEKRTEAACV